MLDKVGLRKDPGIVDHRVATMLIRRPNEPPKPQVPPTRAECHATILNKRLNMMSSGRNQQILWAASVLDSVHANRQQQRCTNDSVHDSVSHKGSRCLNV